MYISSAELAGELLRQRWSDSRLQASVAAFLENDIPDLVRARPHAGLWRPIITPDGELDTFIPKAERTGLAPLCLEYTDDLFSSRNFTKCSLAKPAVQTGINRHGQTIAVRRKIIDMKAAENQPLSNLATLWGESLVVFHHRLLERVVPQMRAGTLDLSSWLGRRGADTRQRYEAVLSLATTHLVLVEDFDLLEQETAFLQDVVLPAYAAVERRFGVAPLIIRLSEPGRHQRDPYWWAHGLRAGAALEDFIQEGKEGK